MSSNNIQENNNIKNDNDFSNNLSKDVGQENSVSKVKDLSNVSPLDTKHSESTNIGMDIRNDSYCLLNMSEKHSYISDKRLYKEMRKSQTKRKEDNSKKTISKRRKDIPRYNPESPYFKRFKESLRNPHTRYFSTYAFNSFLKFVNLTDEELVKLNKEKLQEYLEAYVSFMNNRGFRRRSIRTILGGIERFLIMNRIEYDKKILHYLIGGNTNDDLGGSVPFTNEDIKKMLDFAWDSRIEFIIYMLKDTGMRTSAIEDPPLRMKHLVEMPDGCLALRLYDENPSGFSPSSAWGYWTFLSPESKKSLEKYLEERKRNGEVITPESPLLATNGGKYGYVTRGALNTMLYRLYKKANIPRVKVDKHRWDKAVVYGFRKRFDTILKLDNSINSNIAEKLMAHKKGLDGTYLKPTREECFAEFKKAIPALMVNETEIKKLELEKKEKQISLLEAKNLENKELALRLNKLERAMHRNQLLNRGSEEKGDC